MRQLRRMIVLLLTLALMVTGCTPVDTAPPTSVSARGGVLHGHTTVSAPRGDIEVTVAAPDMTDAWEPLREVTAADLLVGVPIDITASEEGVFVLERTYAAPLPEDAMATWGYFDTDLAVWVPVPSTLSADRTTLRAEVDHLSLWNDFVSGTQNAIDNVKNAATAAGRAVVDAKNAMAGGATKATQWVGEQFVKGSEALSHGVASVFDVRVDPPTCTGEVPDWVSDVVHIETYYTNPIHWCVGRDDADSALLVVKARVSRGFGYGYETTVTPAWTRNSTDDHGLLTTLLSVSGDLGGTMADSMSSLLFGGRIVGAGEEIAFGFDEATARTALATGGRLVEMKLSSTGGFLFSVMTRIVVSQAEDLTEGPVAALVALATCANTVADGAGVAGATRSIITCLASQPEVVASALASSLGGQAKDPRALGKVIGTSVGKVTFYLALVGPTQSVIDYSLEHTLPPAAWQLSISLSIPPRPQATIELGEGSGVTINGTNYGRGGAEEIQALIAALGEPDVERLVSCPQDEPAMTERRWGGLTVSSLNVESEFDVWGAWQLHGIAGWRYEGGAPEAVGPRGIRIGTPATTVRQKYRDDEFFDMWDEDDAISIFGGDTIGATFELDAQGRVSAMRSGFGCRP